MAEPAAVLGVDGSVVVTIPAALVSITRDALQAVLRDARELCGAPPRPIPDYVAVLDDAVGLLTPSQLPWATCPTTS